jgi:hypothetical protein
LSKSMWVLLSRNLLLAFLLIFILILKRVVIQPLVIII